MPTIHCPAGHVVEPPPEARMMFASVSVTERDSVVHDCAECHAQFLRHPDGSVEPLRPRAMATAP